MEPIVLGKLRQLARSGRARTETALGRWAFVQSLPSRLILVVFSTVLVTSAAVAFTATRSTASFLRAGIDQKFPVILEQTAERLDLWYGQRQLDVETFGRSHIVVKHVHVLAGGGSRRASRARSELETYMEIVLERFPQYRALFLLSPDGEPLVWVGEEVALPNTLREQLAGTGHAGVSDLQRAGGSRTQVASAPVAGPGEAPAGSLHALLDTRSLDALLVSEDLSESGRIFVVDGAGDTLAPLDPDGALPELGASGSTEIGEHVLPDGERVIASQRPFERFGWTLWIVEPYEAAFAPVVAVVRRVWAVNLAIVLLLGSLAFWIARSMARPIHDLSEAARRIADGAEDVILPVSDRADEVGVLTRALREMTARLSEKHGDLQRANEILTQLSITDGLTSLHNHRAFQDRLTRDIRRARRTGTPLCLALVDVDDFKRLNDRHGHAVGDRILAGVAEVLRDRVRETDFVARYGGEEFALLASAPLDGAVTVAENLRRAIGEASFEVGEASALRVTVSIGVAPLATDGDALFQAADRALYQAKHSGKDCVVAAEED